MPSTYSPLLRLELIGAGEQSGLWGDTTNKNLGTLLEQAIAGVTTVSLSGGAGDYTLEAKDGTLDQARAAVLKFTGNPSGTKNIIIPTKTKLYVVRNECGQTIIVKTATQVANFVTLLNGEATLVFCDGSSALAGIATTGVGTLLVKDGGTGATSFSGGFVKSPGGTGQLSSSAFVNAATELSGKVGVGNGGTGADTFGAGGILKSAGGTNAITASALNVGTEVTGVLNPINGGTGLNTLGINSVILGNGINPVQAVAPGPNGEVLTSNGVTWQSRPAATGGGGTVTSVGFSTGTTGLIVTGTNPITSSGTFTLGGTLKVENGGTGVGSLTGILKGNGTAQFSAASALDIVNAIGSQPVQVATNATQLGNVAASSYVTTSTLSNYVTTSSLNSTLSGYLTTSGTAANSSQLGSVAAASYARRDAANTFSGANDFTTGTIKSEAYNFTDNTSVYSNNGADFIVAISGQPKMSVDSSGNLTIQGSSATKVGGANTWNVISDRRLKNNITPYTKGLAELVQIQPKAFTYNGKGGTVAGEKSVSIIADEIQQILPDTVGKMALKLNPEDTETTEIQTFNFSEIGWVMVNAIKELKAEVDALKAQLAAK